MPLCCKTKINTRACTTWRKNTMKSQIRPHLSVAKHGLLSNSDRAEAIQCCLHKLKTACRCPITYAFTWCCWHCTRAAWPATAHTGPRKSTCFPRHCHTCIYDATVFCLYFSQNFNIISAIFVHQSPTLPQKIDSREGLFWCKIGVACAWGKMNIYLNKTPFAPISGLFAAKCSAFWCKLQCVLVQIAVRFGANWNAFWC